MKKLLSDVLVSIKPSRKELNGELEFARKLLVQIRDNSAPSCEVVLAGSIAKRIVGYIT